MPFSFQANAEQMTQEEKCGFVAAMFMNFTLPLQTSCETEKDCLVIDDHCMPVFVVAKEQLANEKIKSRFDKQHDNLLKACDEVVSSKKDCPRKINVNCYNHICGATQY